MARALRTTLSLIKADVGGLVGHTNIHPDIIDTARERLYEAKENGVVRDYRVMRCGDDLELIMAHDSGAGSREVHGLAWNIFMACTEEARELKQSDAGEDLVGDAFSGSVKGLGPGVAEIEFDERVSEPVLIFMADKAGAGAWNLPLYKTFADPFNTSGLVMDADMIEGFSFTVLDAREGTTITLSCPDECYYLLALIGSTSRYLIKSVTSNRSGEVSAVTSAERFGEVGGGRVGKDDPVCIVRCQSGFPAVGEALEPYSHPHLVSGWMRSAHAGPLMAVPFYESHPTRFDGPPRVICAGFQVAKGRLIGPSDMFDDPGFDESRRVAGKVSEYMRRHGPFEPHRLGEEELAHTTRSEVMERLKGRFKETNRRRGGRLNRGL